MVPDADDSCFINLLGEGDRNCSIEEGDTVCEVEEGDTFAFEGDDADCRLNIASIPSFLSETGRMKEGSSFPTFPTSVGTG